MLCRGHILDSVSTTAQFGHLELAVDPVDPNRGTEPASDSLQPRRSGGVDRAVQLNRYQVGDCVHAPGAARDACQLGQLGMDSLQCVSAVGDYLRYAARV